MTITYTLYSEKDAASRLGISSITLRRERVEGRIGYLKIRSRVRYTDFHLIDYLARNERCPTTRSELENTFSESVQIRNHGVRAGTILVQDRQNEHLLAQQFFRKQK
ncbi:helix-turn-helix domain-containing protein [Acidomonas methanolica]|uniref:helix-turn-helix domain-containing protein n=1 Tax=Acidomonas methanolica TaxID=437 RepID=UPI00211A0FE4|nr:helix-turn-helix domain-containing protein [Acidomonas methanolica]